ncbi:hypothetical protein [Streptomyces syringium]|uniref:hypothetical protein n=1 Tax=Streptomyces syringium TaxID=76729 RepID=UPI0037CFD761
MPGAVHADVDLHETGGFEDPRLVLYTGVGRLPSPTVTAAARWLDEHAVAPAPAGGGGTA